MAQARFPDGIFVEGASVFSGAAFNENNLTATTAIPRSKLAQDQNAVYAIPFTDLRIHDAFQTVLPGTSSGNDLALDDGTFSTSSQTVRTADVKTTTVTNYARFRFALPAEYDAGQTITLRMMAGMLTTISDGTATLDIEVFKVDRSGGIGSDLYAGAAVNINSLTLANRDFTITPTGLAAGDVLDIRVALAIADTATGTAVIGVIGAIEMLIDIKG
jgi:hypothetical protein